MRGRTAHGARIINSAFHSGYILASQCPDRDMDRSIRAKGQKTGAVMCGMGGKYLYGTQSWNDIRSIITRTFIRALSSVLMSSNAAIIGSWLS
jgi:hypothetical protein